VHRMEWRSGRDGRLSARERARIERMQDRQSRRINRLRHNGPDGVTRRSHRPITPGQVTAVRQHGPRGKSSTPGAPSIQPQHGRCA
jgi:hypothetical protein